MSEDPLKFQRPAVDQHARLSIGTLRLLRTWQNKARHIIFSKLDYPLVNIQKAIENSPFIVDLPIENGDCL